MCVQRHQWAAIAAVQQHTEQPEERLAQMMTIMMIIINTFCRTESARTVAQYAPAAQANARRKATAATTTQATTTSNNNNSSNNNIMYTKIIQNEICFMMRNRATFLRTVWRVCARNVLNCFAKFKELLLFSFVNIQVW